MINRDFVNTLGSISIYLLALIYFSGFIISQFPYINDFGIIPFNQVHYLAFGSIPFLFLIIMFIGLFFFAFIIFPLFKHIYINLSEIIYDKIKSNFIKKVLTIISTKTDKSMAKYFLILTLFETYIFLSIFIMELYLNIKSLSDNDLVFNFNKLIFKIINFETLSALTFCIGFIALVYFIHAFFKEIQPINYTSNLKLIIKNNKNNKHNNMHNLIKYYTKKNFKYLLPALIFVVSMFLFINISIMFSYSSSSQNLSNLYFIKTIPNSKLVFKNHPHSHAEKNKLLAEVILIKPEYVYAYLINDNKRQEAIIINRKYIYEIKEAPSP